MPDQIHFLFSEISSASMLWVVSVKQKLILWNLTSGTEPSILKLLYFFLYFAASGVWISALCLFTWFTKWCWFHQPLHWILCKWFYSCLSWEVTTIQRQWVIIGSHLNFGTTSLICGQRQVSSSWQNTNHMKLGLFELLFMTSNWLCLINVQKAWYTQSVDYHLSNILRK